MIFLDCFFNILKYFRKYHSRNKILILISIFVLIDLAIVFLWLRGSNSGTWLRANKLFRLSVTFLRSTGASRVSGINRIHDSRFFYIFSRVHLFERRIRVFSIYTEMRMTRAGQSYLRGCPLKVKLTRGRFQYAPPCFDTWCQLRGVIVTSSLCTRLCSRSN